MLDSLETPWKYIASALIFPIFFQGQLFQFAWGAGDELSLLIAKRIFLLWPACAIIFCSWLSVLNILSIVIRQNRREFTSALFLTWWDLGRSIFHFWAGLFHFVWVLGGFSYGLIRLAFFGVLLMIKDLVLAPLRIVNEVSNSSFRPGIPWPAIVLMLVWTLIEAAIFTFVMRPLVVDVMESFSDGELIGGPFLKILLFVVFCIFVLGSYAVIYTLQQAVQKKQWGSAITYALIEIIVAAVETVLFYREFVDALVPWFAQHAGDQFELGMFGTLAIAFSVWFGIRCMTWFLFGASAIPMLLAMIQRTGIDTKDGGRGGAMSRTNNPMLVYVHTAVEDFKKDMNWVQSKGDVLLSALVIPPLQILASSTNFCSLLIGGNHLFNLPFRSYKDVLDTRDLLEKARKSVRKD